MEIEGATVPQASDPQMVSQSAKGVEFRLEELNLDLVLASIPSTFSKQIRPRSVPADKDTTVRTPN